LNTLSLQVAAVVVKADQVGVWLVVVVQAAIVLAR
jgi:hypothetical protein